MAAHGDRFVECGCEVWSLSELLRREVTGFTRALVCVFWWFICSDAVTGSALCYDFLAVFRPVVVSSFLCFLVLNFFMWLMMKVLFGMCMYRPVRMKKLLDGSCWWVWLCTCVSSESGLEICIKSTVDVQWTRPKNKSFF